MCLCAKSLLSQNLPVCSWHRQICSSWVWALCGQEGRAGCGRVHVQRRGEGVVAEEKRRRGQEAWRGGEVLRLRPGIDDSVIGRREGAHPCAASPPNIKHAVLCWYMENGWAALLTDAGQVHQRIYLFTRLKGAKASAKQRLKLGVSPDPGLWEIYTEATFTT